MLILGLTRSKRNFLNAPPEDIDFPFNYDEALPVAIASLQADQRLDMARFCLVPMYLKGIVNDCNNKRTRRISSKDCCHERVSGLLYALSLHPETEKEGTNKNTSPGLTIIRVSSNNAQRRCFGVTGSIECTL